MVEMRAAFEGSVAEQRQAFRALLGDRKMPVFPDAERCFFRVEAGFELALERADARDHVGLRASATAGSGGGRYARVCRVPVPLTLPVVGRIPRAAAA